MKSLHIITLLLLAATAQVKSQTHQFDWAARIGGTGFDIVNDAATDAAGNSYITGIYHNTVDFNPGAGVFNMTSQGSNDVFIVKLDASGNFVWAKSLGGLSDDKSNAIAVGSGKLFITGRFAGTADFDPGSGTASQTSSGFTDGFLVSLDTAGNFIAVARAGGSGGDNIMDVTLNGPGTCVVSGFFESTLNFFPPAPGSALVSAGSYDAFIACFDLSLNPVWTRRMGGPTADHASAIGSDGAGNIVYGGFFTGTGDYDPGPAVFNLTTTGSFDLVISRLTPNGDFDWAIHVGGNNDELLNGIAVDDNGTIAATGYFLGTADFDPGNAVTTLVSSGLNDSFVMLLDENGNLDWVRKTGGTLQDEGKYVAIGSAGDVLVAGYFSSTVDLDPGTAANSVASSGGTDGFVIRLSEQGDYLESATFGSVDDDVAHVAGFVPGDGVLAAGTFMGAMDADPFSGAHQLTPAGLSDVFIVRLSASFTGVPEDHSMMSKTAFPNPATSQVSIIQSGGQGPSRIAIYNESGAEVYSTETWFDEKAVVDIAGWQSGIYHAVIENGMGRFVARFVKTGSLQ
jgi:hypothetical protein